MTIEHYGKGSVFPGRSKVWDDEKQETPVFLTNHLEFGATTIAPIYKQRWQVDLFLKALETKPEESKRFWEPRLTRSALRFGRR